MENLSISNVINIDNQYCKKVDEFNTLFEIEKYNGEFKDIFENNEKLVKYRYALVDEEISELLDAFKNNDKKEMIDAVADILYVVYGMILTLNMSKEITIINTSKFWRSIKDYMYHLGNESDKLSDGIKNKDLNVVVSSISLILGFTFSVAEQLRIDPAAAFSIVHESNMSKLCSSEEEAKETVAYYKSIDPKSEKYYDSPSYRKAVNDGYWIVYNKSTTKILKNINYKPANFDVLLTTSEFMI